MTVLIPSEDGVRLPTGRVHQSQGGQSLVRPLIIIIVMTVLIPSEDGVRLPTGRAHQSQGGQSLAPL